MSDRYELPCLRKTSEKDGKGLTAPVIQNNWQHYLNPLHVYCRLRDLHFSERLALIVTREYEKIYNSLNGKH